MKTNYRIAVIGGGPGGLTLARILQTRGIAVSVFEAEASALARPQGGTLDLHAKSGQHALHLAGLDAEFKAVARYEDQGVKLYDPMGKLVHDDAGRAEDDRPEVDRTALRQLLLDSLEPSVVRWGHKLMAVVPREDGAYEVSFGNGVTATFDLVVGADGTWSRVRPLVSAEKPVYSGVTFVDMFIENVDELHPQIAELVGRGKMFALGNNQALIAQRNGYGLFRIAAALRIVESWMAQGGLDLGDVGKARAGLLELYKGWAPELLELIEKSGNWIVAYPIYALPIGHRWENRPGITLIGDAAHVMSPFSGEGANLAMLDGADLAEALSHGKDWKQAVREFEEVMFPRAAGAAAGAKQGIDEAISENGLAHAVEMFEEHVGPH